MEWLATAIRTYKGQASVVQAQGFDDFAGRTAKRLFLEAPSRDYQKLLHAAKKLLARPPFREDASGTMVMGDLVLTEDEVEPFMMKLPEGGIHEFCKKL